MSVNAFCANATDIGTLYSMAYARIFERQPSNSRMLERTFEAMYIATSSGRLSPCPSAFFLRMAIRVSKSGG